MRGKNRRGPRVALQKPASVPSQDGVGVTSKRNQVSRQPSPSIGTDFAVTRFADDMAPYMQELVFKCEHPVRFRPCSPTRLHLSSTPPFLTTNSYKSLPS